jgi:hypothetical protein
MALDRVEIPFGDADPVARHPLCIPRRPATARDLALAAAA